MYYARPSHVSHRSFALGRTIIAESIVMNQLQVSVSTQSRPYENGVASGRDTKSRNNLGE